jgi:FRG domain
METIGESKLWTFLPGSSKSTISSCMNVRKANAVRVSDYMELASKVAELQFLNRDHVLLFRGQRTDHKNNKGNSRLKPSLFRAVNGRNPDAAEVNNRFYSLSEAERVLTEEFERARQLGRDRLKRQQVLRWSILQHYEICSTPLLDVTHSLRIASSFGSAAADNQAFVFVLGVPNLSGAITASAEAGIQIVRLSSVCPPAAVRPHIQEGYLLGEYPEMTGYDQKQYYAHFEIDFERRLVAKFKFNPQTLWKNSDFPRVKGRALYPNRGDPVFDLAQSIKNRLNGN